MMYAKSNYGSAVIAREFVAACDLDFEKRLEFVTSEIACKEGIKVITLSGPTCSGKTTAAKKIVADLAEHSKRVNIISIDDFYYDKAYLIEKHRLKGENIVDYESAEAIDLSCLKEFIDDIFDDEYDTLKCPVFDFTQGKRVGYKEIECTEEDVFLFEGIQALYPKVFDMLDDYPYTSVYICASSFLSVGSEVFAPNEIRLLRRLVRDHHFRATSPQATLDMWKNVRANEDKNIFPNIDMCHYKVDSTYACEIGLLKPYLVDILSQIPLDDKHYRMAQDILKKVADVEELPKSYILDDSLYHEFI